MGIGAAFWGSVFLLSNPMERIDRGAAGGGNLLGDWADGASSAGLDGSLGGSVGGKASRGLEGSAGEPLGLGGVFGARAGDRDTFGADFTVINGTFGVFVALACPSSFAFSSRSRLVGGRGGSFA